MSRGIYIMANDAWLDQAIALVSSVRAHDRETPIALIPYDDRYRAVADVLRRCFGVRLYPDLGLVARVEASARRIIGDADLVAPHNFRKQACWFGPFDQFLYLDSDIVVFERIAGLLDYLAEYDFVCCDDQSSNGLRHVFTERIRDAGVLRPEDLGEVFNAGLFGSRKGLVSEADLIETFEACSRHRDCFPFHEGVTDQPVMNFLVLTRIRRRVNVFRHLSDEPLMWAGRSFVRQGPHLIDPRVNRRLRYVHWAGIDVNASAPYWETWNHYRFLHQHKRAVPGLGACGESTWRRSLRALKRADWTCGRVSGARIRWPQATESRERSPRDVTMASSATVGSMDEHARIRTLDGLRGIAILLVMVHHFAQGLLPMRPTDGPVLAAARMGWVGVDLFFVLSGFLITGILYDTRLAKNYFYAFYARRVLRIFPLYYAALAFFFVVLPHFVNHPLGRAEARWAWYWLYSSNILTAREGWLSRYLNHFWSLAIEEQFYLVWPVVVAFLSRRWLLAVCVGLVMTAATARGALYAGAAGVSANFTYTFTRADALALGAILALMLRDASDAARLRRLAPWLLAATLPVALVLLSAHPTWAAWIVWGLRDQVLGYTIVGVTCAAAVGWLVASERGSLRERVFGNASLRFLGRYSYGMYVIHLPLDNGARVLGIHVTPLADKFGAVAPALLLYSLIAGTLTVALALVSWHLLEKHFLGLKRHFRPVFERALRAP